MSEIDLSTAVEADGPIPAPQSMLSLGAAAYGADKRLLATFSANVETLRGAAALPQTAAWWATQPEAWAAFRSDLEPPEAAMQRHVAWLDGPAAHRLPRQCQAEHAKHGFDPVPHSHVALDDAIDHGWLFCNMLEDNRGARRRIRWTEAREAACS